ncbi:MAG TPA: hypothetical protein VJZ03_04295 [Candidatus Bathyarchaeia archaeon]|jgi:hypothetical protein|nr:hypothetical protein [Candidatus Bathyarchaeia archaeon]
MPQENVDHMVSWVSLASTEIEQEANELGRLRVLQNFCHEAMALIPWQPPLLEMDILGE